MSPRSRYFEIKPAFGVSPAQSVCTPPARNGQPSHPPPPASPPPAASRAAATDAAADALPAARRLPLLPAALSLTSLCLLLLLQMVDFVNRPELKPDVLILGTRGLGTMKTTVLARRRAAAATRSTAPAALPLQQQLPFLPISCLCNLRY